MTIRWAQWAALIVLGAATLLPLAGCGKVGSPALPPGVKATYPRTYPSNNNDG